MGARGLHSELLSHLKVSPEVQIKLVAVSYFTHLTFKSERTSRHWTHTGTRRKVVTFCALLTQKWKEREVPPRIYNIHTSLKTKVLDSFLTLCPNIPHHSFIEIQPCDLWSDTVTVTSTGVQEIYQKLFQSHIQARFNVLTFSTE